LFLALLALAFLPCLMAQDSPSGKPAPGDVPVGATPVPGSELVKPGDTPVTPTPTDLSNPKDAPIKPELGEGPSVAPGSNEGAKVGASASAPPTDGKSVESKSGGNSDAVGKSWDDKKFPKSLPVDPNAAPTTIPAAEEAPDAREGFWKVLLGIALITGILIGLIWYLKKSPRTKKFFGAGPIKVLSRSHLGPRQTLYLVKAGERVLLIGQGNDGLRTLMEVSDPGEVSRTIAMVEEGSPGSMSATFRDALASATGQSKRSDSTKPAPDSSARKAPAARVDATAGDDGDSIRVDPGYSTQLKLAALRGQLEQSKAKVP